ncbi:MAG: hypothetical protein R2748_18065 [Bryobacterales bacterium]
MALFCNLLPALGVLAAFASTASALNDAEMERFLLEADVLNAVELDVGVTHSRKLTLSDGVRTHAAHFQAVDEHKLRHVGKTFTEMDFRDSYRYNIAAYRLDRLLGLDMIPVSVERAYAGQTGAFTWWIPNTLMMEAERMRRHVKPPNRFAWNHDMYRARLFQELIYNIDPNPGNTIIDKDWRIWLVDFTRSFRRSSELRTPGNIKHVDRRLWQALLALDEDRLREAMDGILFNFEIRALLERRDAIVKLVEERIATQGEQRALCGDSHREL